MQFYIDQGFSPDALWRFFNPDGFFDEVYVVSWQEPRDWVCGDLEIVSLPFCRKAMRRIRKYLQYLYINKTLPEPFLGGIFQSFRERIVSTFRSIDADIIRAYNGHWAAELGLVFRQKVNIPFVC